MANPFETKVQDLVYNLDVGMGQRLIKGGLYILAILALMVYYFASQFQGLHSEEAMDFAQLGRNLMERGHFVTQYVRPASMTYLKENGPRKDPQILDHPDLFHPPAYPFALSLGFKVFDSLFEKKAPTALFPPEQLVIIPLNLFFALLTGLLVFLSARKLFDERTGLLATTLFFLSHATWSTSLSGLPIALATLFTTAAFYCLLLVQSDEEDGAQRWILPIISSALFAALAFLTRYGTLPVLLGGLIYLGMTLHAQRRKKVMLMYLGIFVLLISPWIVRNIMVSGLPLGLAPLSSLNLESAATYDRALHPKTDMATISNTLQIKWLVNLRTLYCDQLRSLGDGLLICFFLVTYFYTFVRVQVRAFRWALAGAMVSFILLAAFFGPPTYALLHIFWPFTLIYGLAFFNILVDRLQLSLLLFRLIVVSIFIFLNALPLIFALLPPRSSPPYPPYHPPYISHVSHQLQPDELLCTDMPWATAWYGSRTSVLMPSLLDDFYEINDFYKRINGLYFTTLTRDQPFVRQLLSGPYKSWAPIIVERRIPVDFPLNEGSFLNGMDQFFLTDRKR